MSNKVVSSYHERQDINNMKCIKCGNELSANAKFCGKCGTSTANMEAAPSASNNASPVGSTVMLGAAAEVHDEEKTVILGANPIAQAPVHPQAPQMQAPVQPQPMNMQAMPVQNQQNKKDKKQKKEKKKGKAGLVIALVLIVLLAAGGGGFAFWWLNLPVNKMSAAWNKGDIDSAIDIYNEIEDDDEAIEKAQEKALAHISELRDGYIQEAEGMDYDTVIEPMKKLCDSILEDSDEAEDILKETETIGASRLAYEEAVEAQNRKKYTKAIKKYNEVSKEDEKYYELAKKAIDEVSGEYRKEVLDNVKKYCEEGKYDEATTELKDALKILSKDAELKAELDKVNAEAEEVAFRAMINSVDEAIKAENFDVAFDAMDAAEEKYPENEEVLQKKAELEAAYIKNMTPKWEALYFAGDIDGAIALVEEACERLPENEYLPNLLIAYGQVKPIPLDDLTVYENNCYGADYLIGLEVQDTFEETYANATRLTLESWSSAKGDVVFLNNGRYNYLSGVLAYEYNGTEYTKGSVCFEIYADDKLVYSFSPINDATRALEFEVSIEDCHKLRIVWKHSGNNERASIIFSDAKVYRK